MIRDFQIVSRLGDGAYSSVYKVKRLTDGQEYALKRVKIMNLSDKEKENALNEVRILASIRHPNIIQYKEVFLDEGSNSLCIIMEYADSGDLFQKINTAQKKGSLLPEEELWTIFIQIVKGLKALHDQKVFHRDLKSANVFICSDGNVKLGDMNVSKIAKKGLLYTQTGTPYYASPEVWKDQPYDQKSDIWSLGCVLYEAATLKPPFRAEDMEGLFKKVTRGLYQKLPSHYSVDLNNVIRSLLQVSPHLRPNCDKILQLPAVIKRIEDKMLSVVDENQKEFLKTILWPRHPHYLTERLPKPNYEPLRLKKVDRQRFLQTLGGNIPRESHHFGDFSAKASIYSDDQGPLLPSISKNDAIKEKRMKSKPNLHIEENGRQSRSKSPINYEKKEDKTQIREEEETPKGRSKPKKIQNVADENKSSLSKNQTPMSSILSIKQIYGLKPSKKILPLLHKAHRNNNLGNQNNKNVLLSELLGSEIEKNMPKNVVSLNEDTQNGEINYKIKENPQKVHKGKHIILPKLNDQTTTKLKKIICKFSNN